jgi:hypothetical protein
MAAPQHTHWFTNLIQYTNLYWGPSTPISTDHWFRGGVGYVAPKEPHFEVTILMNIAQHHGFGGWKTMHEFRTYTRAFPVSSWKLTDFANNHLILRTPCCADHKDCPLSTEVQITELTHFGPSADPDPTPDTVVGDPSCTVEVDAI